MKKFTIIPIFNSHHSTVHTRLSRQEEFIDKKKQTHPLKNRKYINLDEKSNRERQSPEGSGNLSFHHRTTRTKRLKPCTGTFPISLNGTRGAMVTLGSGVEMSKPERRGHWQPLITEN